MRMPDNREIMVIGIILFILILPFFLRKAEPAKPDVEVQGASINLAKKNWQFKASCNPCFHVSEVEIDGRVYLVLHDSGKAVGIVAKTPPNKGADDVRPENP